MEIMNVDKAARRPSCVAFNSPSVNVSSRRRLQQQLTSPPPTPTRDPPSPAPALTRTPPATPHPASLKPSKPLLSLLQNLNPQNLLFTDYRGNRQDSNRGGGRTEEIRPFDSGSVESKRCVAPQKVVEFPRSFLPRHHPPRPYPTPVSHYLPSPLPLLHHFLLPFSSSSSKHPIHPPLSLKGSPPPFLLPPPPPPFRPPSSSSSFSSSTSSSSSSTSSSSSSSSKHPLHPSPPTHPPSPVSHYLPSPTPFISSSSPSSSTSSSSSSKNRITARLTIQPASFDSSINAYDASRKRQTTTELDRGRALPNVHTIELARRTLSGDDDKNADLRPMFLRF
ncbi:uncharacterized protein [Macrobrachium rosenbergii]|uniref:uncharacterized protein n=1 Tax=Macrobrachium rosenbergii TaxID=79674 RepID=UPI0034D4E132